MSSSCGPDEALMSLYRRKIEIRETQLKRITDLFRKNSAQEAEVEEAEIRLLDAKILLKEHINA